MKSDLCHLQQLYQIFQIQITYDIREVEQEVQQLQLQGPPFATETSRVRFVLTEVCFSSPYRN